MWFYILEQNANQEPHGIEFGSSWNPETKYFNGQSSKNRWKNGVICLDIKFTLIVMVIKM